MNNSIRLPHCRRQAEIKLMSRIIKNKTVKIYLIHPDNNRDLCDIKFK